MRRKIVAGNWKMNMSYEDGQALVSEIIHLYKEEANSEVEVIIAPPAIYLQSFYSLISKEKSFSLSAQNCHTEKKGAFTGEISASMLHAIHCQYVIVGHSERRMYFHESHEFLRKKIDATLSENLIPIFCCGELTEDRLSGRHIDIVKKQLEESLFHLPESLFEKVIIAYEPVWAIGTGETATPDQAQEMHHHIREFIAQKYNQQLASKIPLLYGGSCNALNAASLFSQADIDGGLIGGASLRARDFLEIIKSF